MSSAQFMVDAEYVIDTQLYVDAVRASWCRAVAVSTFVAKMESPSLSERFAE